MDQSANPLTPGLAGHAEMVVTERDLASALGSGDVAVLGTPRLIALAEAATAQAIARALAPGQTSVGTRVAIRHLAASPLGAAIKATAELTELAGKALTFRVEVHDGCGLIADGNVERAIVDRARFLARACLPRP